MASCLLANQSSQSCRVHSQHLPKRLLEGVQSFCEALGACCTRPPQEAPSPAIRRVLCYAERERPGRGSRRTKTYPRRRPPASASVHAPAPAHTLVRGPSAPRLIGTARFALQWSSPAVARAVCIAAHAVLGRDAADGRPSVAGVRGTLRRGPSGQIVKKEMILGFQGQHAIASKKGLHI